MITDDPTTGHCKKCGTWFGIEELYDGECEDCTDLELVDAWAPPMVTKEGIDRGFGGK